MKAWSLIRPQPWYRADAFKKGLEAVGYEVRTDEPKGGPGNVLLIWNRYGLNHGIAERFERSGGTVLVAENGYIGKGGTAPKFDVHPHGPKPDSLYALGVSWHNDHRCWKSGGPERWVELGIEVKPWRKDGKHILVAANRSFGVPGRSMPPEWPTKTVKRLKRETSRPVILRRHPGNDAPRRPLSADLEGAWACVVWSSSSGVHALLAGIPTFCDAPAWSMRPAAASGSVDAPVCPDRLPALERLAWGQWRLDEIESGKPFGHLLSAAVKAEIATAT